jgi:hypothetical protein
VLIKILNHWISKQKLSDNKLLKKLFQMQPFSDLAQSLVKMITLLQIFKDKHSSFGTILCLFMMIAQLLNNQLKITTLEDVF